MSIDEVAEDLSSSAERGVRKYRLRQPVAQADQAEQAPTQLTSAGVS